MRNALSLYVDTSPGTTDELNERIAAMEEAVSAQFSDAEKRLIESVDRVYKKQGTFLTLPVLEGATGYTVESLSNIRNGNTDVPQHLIRHIRVLHKRVTENPEIARVAVMDWLDRKLEDPVEEALKDV